MRRSQLRKPQDPIGSGRLILQRERQTRSSCARDPLASGRELLDAHRGGDVEPHPLAEELVDALRARRRRARGRGRPAARSTRGPARGSPRRRTPHRPGAGASGSRGGCRAARCRPLPIASSTSSSGARRAGSNSAAARVNVSSTSSKPRSTAARNSSRLLANRLNTYGCATPTRRAIRSTGVPCRPPWANSWTAASISASRRSAAGTR